MLQAWGWGEEHPHNSSAPRSLEDADLGGGNSWGPFEVQLAQSLLELRLGNFWSHISALSSLLLTFLLGKHLAPRNTPGDLTRICSWLLKRVYSEQGYSRLLSHRGHLHTPLGELRTMSVGIFTKRSELRWPPFPGALGWSAVGRGSCNSAGLCT